MEAMIDVARTIELPPGIGPLTVDDLDVMPDDGRRYELIDGVLLVSPGVVFLHQRICGRLTGRLQAACRPELEVVGPFSFNVSPRDFVIPDVAVVRLRDEPPEPYPRDLRLAVEVLSPSTRRRDVTLKKQFYADAGVLSYWVVDPEPSVLAWDLVDGAYEQVGHVFGEDELVLDLPFPVRVSPADLIRR